MIIIVFIFGLLIGSFLNVCIYRIPRGESIAYPPSHCTKCNNRIKPYDLVPVLSYMVLKGRCRYCKDKISLRYPIVELFTGIIFAAVYIRYDLSYEFVKYCILSALLIIIGLIDYDTSDIYDNTILTGFIFGMIFLAANRYFELPIKTYLIGALTCGALISVIILLTGGMGWGDAELSALLGLFFGIKLSYLALFLSVVIGGLAGILLILTKKKSRKDYIPFGPFMATAAIITLLFGDKILQLYFHTFFK